jgi:hypothetical protein
MTLRASHRLIVILSSRFSEDEFIPFELSLFHLEAPIDDQLPGVPEAELAHAEPYAGAPTILATLLIAAENVLESRRLSTIKSKVTSREAW